MRIDRRYRRTGGWAALLAAFLVLSPAAAQTSPTPSTEEGDWRIQFRQISGRTNYCGTDLRYTPPAMIIVDRISTERRVILTVYTDDAPALSRDEDVRVTLRFTMADVVQSTPVRGVAAQTTTLNGVSVAMTEPVLLMFERATELSVSYSGYRSRPLSLAGSTRAMRGLRGCIAERF